MASSPETGIQAATLTAFVVQVRYPQLHSSFKVTPFSSPEWETKKILEVEITRCFPAHTLSQVLQWRPGCEFGDHQP